MPCSSTFLSTALLAIVLPFVASGAQQVAPRTIAGIVRDTSGKAIDSVEVLILGRKSSARTDSAGRFRIANVDSGHYTIRARRIGYRSQTQQVVLDITSGAFVDFSLVPIVHALTPVVSFAKAGGLSGVVGDTSYHALPGVEVRAVNGGQVSTTDSAGAFFLDLKSGSYTITFRKDHYATRLLGVHLPPDSGKRVMIWLPPQDKPPIREMAQLQEMSHRAVMRSAVWGKVWTHDDIMASGVDDLRQLLHQLAMGDLTYCVAMIDGGPNRAPLSDIEPEDVEIFEVDVKAPAMPGSALWSGKTNGKAPSRSAGGSSLSSRAPVGCPPPSQTNVWLRK
jgi:hypothetical protein